MINKYRTALIAIVMINIIVFTGCNSSENIGYKSNIESTFKAMLNCPNAEITDNMTVSYLGEGAPKDKQQQDKDKEKTLEKVLSDVYSKYFTENGYSKFLYPAKYHTMVGSVSGKTEISDIKIIESDNKETDFINYDVTAKLAFTSVEDKSTTIEIEANVRCDMNEKIDYIRIYDNSEKAIDELIMQ